MIRRITKDPEGQTLEKPYFLAICDIVDCQNMATYVIEEPEKGLVASLTSPAAAQAADPIVRCIQSLMAAGWGMTWLQHRCHRHEAIAHQLLAQQQSRILLPNGPLPSGMKN